MTARAGFIRRSRQRSEKSPPGGQIRGRCAIKTGRVIGREGMGLERGRVLSKLAGEEGTAAWRKTAVKASFCPALHPGGVSTLPSFSPATLCGGLGLTCTRCL